MASLLETPSRVWRRIQVDQDRDMPSLPSLPAFDDSADPHITTTDDGSEDEMQIASPIHSTPAALSNAASTLRAPSSTSSTARFANSLASRSTKSLSTSRGTAPAHVDDGGFDISSIHSLPDVHRQVADMDIHSSDQETEDSSVPEAHLPPALDDQLEAELDLSDALQSVSRSNSPALGDRETPRKKSDYDFSVSLRSEPKVSPFEKLRNVSFRRPLSRTRTPSLTRTTSSPSSSTTNSTPHSTRSNGWPRADTDPPLAALSVPLPRSATASPALPPNVEERDLTQTSLEHSINDTELIPEVAQSRSEQHQAASADDRYHADDASKQQSQHSREPTFSSEEAGSADFNGSTGSGANGSRAVRSPTPLSVAFSSPASALFTPTPAFQPRPRARFSAPLNSTTPQLPSTTPQQPQVRFSTDETPRQQQFEQAASDEQEDGVHAHFEDPATPHAHKRSFLLSVINSTARPRLRYPTPHPGNSSDESQSQSPASQSLVQATPGVNLRKAFAGFTPRPSAVKRPRLSHPLTQTWNPASDSGSGSDSPYDPAIDRASFVSTASSHDLTTHARANASFDPVIGLGERGHGVGRFNAGKLNSYLHGLNRRLQEENEMLVARLRAFEDKYGRDASASPAASSTPSSSATPAWDPPQQRRQSGGRRVSAGPPLGLGDVAEDVAEVWLEEKAALEEMIEELKVEIESCTADKEKAEEALQTEKSERARDKERWRERMTEVEKGVEGIVADLEKRLGEAEEAAKRASLDRAEGIKDVENRLAVVMVEKDVLAERLKKAEAALENGRELGAEVNAANERLANVKGELQNAQRQIKELEDEVMRSDARLDETEAALHAERKRTAALEDELREKMNELTDAVHHAEDLEENVRKLRAQLREAESTCAQYEADAAADNSRIQDLEQQLAVAQENVNHLAAELEQEQQENDRLVDEAERSSELARQMETALKAAEKKMKADEEEVATLKATIASMERAAEKQQERSVSQLGPSASTVALQAEVETLEAELADAHKELARLQTVIAQSPARKAIEKAKDARIELLEKEKEDLLERLKSTKNQSGIFGTPGRLVNASNMSPMHRQLLNMSFKSPKTPGGPLRDLSWLQSTMQDPSVSPLIAELARLQHELDRANASIDDKLYRLEDAGFGAVDLMKQLEDAREHILALEDEIARLCRREERRVRRIERLRCRKCRTKIDMRGLQSADVGDESSILEASTTSLPSEPPTPPTRTTEALRSELEELNTQLESMKRAWDEERKKLLGENAVLQDAATRLNVEVRHAKDEIRKYADAERLGEKARAGIQGTKAQREKETLLLDLRRTESDMADVREQLQHIKQENHELEKELRSNATAEQKARLLEAKVAENLENMEQLRQERSMLAADHKELQRRYAKASEEVNRLKSEFAASQTSHDNRRHELDLRALEIEDLRRALSDQASNLERLEAEKARMATEKGDVARTVAALEADLRRVRRDAEAFGRDLKALRAQKEKMEAEKKEERTKAERAQKQAQAQIRILKEELDGHKEKARELQKQWKGHVCAADDRQLVALKQQHNKECKGLMVQIRYLKAKFTREWTFRCDLGYQKQYLLVLMARLERNEEKILAAIARIGYPQILSNPSPPKAKCRKFKSLVDSIIFIHRSRRASEHWRQHRSAKPAIEAALQEVRKQRAANGTAVSS
ncbi:hypothetical protein BN946_scf185008.g74 [Trametes cinnabarina]|uniref:Pericentrin/AKAP-450 centrosomal targeting domain-containing protein n=1 Tax=Pycnoporus cinnabarinus TaxID=5643 RepID=A0A060SFQ9_PYCCI|nr:hypothetical protein BN946_scf185008.g74 [Trametes cinnabarina]